MRTRRIELARSLWAALTEIGRMDKYRISYFLRFSYFIFISRNQPAVFEPPHTKQIVNTGRKCNGLSGKYSDFICYVVFLYVFTLMQAKPSHFGVIYVKNLWEHKKNIIIISDWQWRAIGCSIHFTISLYSFFASHYVFTLVFKFITIYLLLLLLHSDLMKLWKRKFPPYP